MLISFLSFFSNILNLCTKVVVETFGLINSECEIRIRLSSFLEHMLIRLCGVLQYGGGKPPVPVATNAGTPRRHPDFAKAEGYAGPVPGVPNSGSPQSVGARFGGAWGNAFPRGPQTQSPTAPWRPPSGAAQQTGWPPQPYQQVSNSSLYQY